MPIRQTTRLALPAALLALAGAAQAADTTFTFKGYVKADALFSRFSAGEVASTNGLRDFWSPSALPVGNGSSSSVFDAHAKQTRFIFNTSTPAGEQAVKTHIELDFMSAIDGNERATNGYEPELRQAFIQYDRWLVGQAWSTFQDVAALPDSLDFVGPSEGTVFVRQPQVRYSTPGGLSLALENSETTVTAFNNASSTVSGDGRLPDFAARQVWKHAKGHLSLGALLREVRTVNNAGRDRNELGAGVTFSGRYNVDDANDVRWMVTTGEGIGRYVGLNIANDVAEDATGELDTIGVTAGFVALHHRWAPAWRSMAGVSLFSADNPVASTGGTVTAEVRSMIANLVHTPVERLDVGVELLHAERETEAGSDGNLDRVQFSAKYSF